MDARTDSDESRRSATKEAGQTSDIEDPRLSTLAQDAAPGFEPNRWLRWLYTRFFRQIKIDDRWGSVVRESATEGTVVYVMRAISLLDFLCLDYLIKRFRLPLLRFVNDLGLWILEPFGRGERRLRLRRQIPQEEALARVLHEGESALLFLLRPPNIGERPTGHGLDVDLIRTLVEQQRKLERPIRIVPQTFVWTKRPPNKEHTLLDLLFGPSEWPGRLRVLLRFVFNFRNAELRSGEPFDVAAFLARHQDLTDAQAADRIRYALLRRIERERQVVLGPKKKTASRIRQELIRSPRVQKVIEAAAREQNKSVAAIEKQADRELRRLCAMMDPNVIGLFARFVNWLLTRIYDGVVIDMPGLERVREAARNGPLILLPSHKSHVDYLVLSYIFATNSVSPPLIAAGDNLSFFPLGIVLRRSGAFFIRRSFSGRRLYAALVDAYVRKILLEGFNVEFFMEGGRSRTGKLLPPKLGLLSMVVDAGLKLPSVELSFVPISVGYERIIEDGAYAREMGGGEKRPESVSGLLSSSRVLRSRYGRLYIQFGPVFALSDLLAEAHALREEAVASEASDLDGAPPSSGPSRDLRPSERRALINRIAHRVTYEIDRATVTTPAALVASALLSHDKRGMRHGELMDRAAELLAALQRKGARVASTVTRPTSEVVPPPDRVADAGVARELINEEAVRETLSLFADAKLVTTADESPDDPIYTMPEEGRIRLEYYKNTVLHFFVPSALIACALAARGGAELEATLRQRVAELSRIFKYEFMYRADASFDDIFDDALTNMVEGGELLLCGDEVRVAPGSLTLIYARMLRTYFESYRLTTSALSTLEEPVKTKEFVKKTLALGQRRYLAGDVELRESIAGPKIENALRTLHDRGLVKIAGAMLEPAAALSDDESARAFERRLSEYLAPPDVDVSDDDATAHTPA